LAGGQSTSQNSNRTKSSERGRGRGLRLSDVPRMEEVVEAIRKALRAGHEPRNLALVSILAFTGCRLSEALLLTKDDLDMRGRTVRIRQLKKGREFYRVVPVPSDLFWQVVHKYANRAPGDKLFDITARQARNIVYAFSLKYLRRRIRPHALRHAYATFVLKHTRDLETVRRLLGHAGYDVIKAYLDYTQEDLEERLFEAFSRL